MPLDLASMIEKLITERGSAAVMRDHLALFRDRAKILEEDNAKLSKRVKELEELTSDLATQLASAKLEKDKLLKPERETTSGELLVDEILWAYAFDKQSGEWKQFTPRCPYCRTRALVEDTSSIYALTEEARSVRYRCDHESCGKLNITFHGTPANREEKAARHILRKYEKATAGN